MVANRIIDNASVSPSPPSIGQKSWWRTRARKRSRTSARKSVQPSSALPSEQRFDCEWAVWANGVAVRELDMHDTFLAADYSHPGDNIPALLAVAQQTGRSGADLLRGLVVAYEIQIDLVRSICLHEFKKDHIAHLCPSVAAGLGAMLGLDIDTIYQAIQQAVHVGFSTRQSRKGEISSWKAYAPAHAGKLGIEAVDRAMRGEKSPSPIYEGEDSVIAWMLGGAKAAYDVPLPAPGESCRGILDSYTKQHSAEYQAQAWIDLAFRLRGKIPDLRAIKSVMIHTSHHTHAVIGSGANDPQKYDPRASRETLDHSLMFIFAAALHTGFWHHVKSYAPEVAQHPQVVELWNKIKTVEDPEWTRRYHSTDPKAKSLRWPSGNCFQRWPHLVDETRRGRRPPARRETIRPRRLHQQIQNAYGRFNFAHCESDRFIDTVQQLAKLTPSELSGLNVVLPPGRLNCATRDKRGIF